MTEPAIKQPRHISDTRTAKDWLDALATGTCDQRTFLRGLAELLARSPEAGWDMLALLDQYYRRGKISADNFTTLKTHLQDLLMGKVDGEPAPEIQIPTVREEIQRTPTVASAVVTLPTAEARASQEPRTPTTVRMPGSRAPLQGLRPSVERAPVEGDVLRGRYQLQALVGRGAMGSVYAALDLSRVDEPEGDRRVAVKVLHSIVMQRPRLLADMRREFQHLQALSHPNIVRVHEFDRDGDVAFFTMELLHGTTVRELLAAQGPRGVDHGHALAIIRDVGAALAHAHSRGIVHGDLNPKTIIVTDQGDVRVLDFGSTLAMHRAPWIQDPDDPREAPAEPPTFVSCEVLEGAAADPSDDLYALSCVAYLLLAGHHPFQDISALKARSLRVEPRRPRGLTQRQWRALRAGLQLERAKRPATVTAWLAEMEVDGAVRRQPLLQSLRAVTPARRGSAPWLFAGLAAVLLGAGVWWIAAHPDSIQAQAAEWRARLGSLTSSDADAQLPAPLPPTADSPAAERAIPDRPAGAAPQVAAAPPVNAPAPAVTAPAPAATSPAPARPPYPVPGAEMPRSAARLALPASHAAAPEATPDPGFAPGGAHARIELAADNVEVAPGDSTARILVKRTRSLRGDVSFSWWTESGTAKPGQDFVAVKSHVETIPNGKGALTLLVPIVMDPGRHQERNFYIVIDEPSENAALGPRTLTMVTIPAPQPD